MVVRPRTSCNARPQPPPGPEGSNGSGFASCAADHPGSGISPRMYQVIARKYRPQKFSELVSQEHVRTTIENAITQNRIAHGYIFSGQRGTGKTTVARILARCLNCFEGS